MNGARHNWIVLSVAAAAVLAAVSAGGGYWFARRGSASINPAHSATIMSSSDGIGVEGKDRKPLYWYDPMVPNQHFDKPGKSPFMDMQLVPQYADAGGGEGGVKIDPSIVQNLGVRLTPVERGTLSRPLDAFGSITFNQRNVAVVQARTNGFVARVYARAPGDVIRREAPLVDLLVPEWAGAQTEFLAMLKSGDRELVAAAQQRLLLLGMPADLIASIEASRQPRTTVTVRAPLGGVIASLEVREGMTVASGATMARINGLATVWLEAALPEAAAELAPVGKTVEAHLTAYPGESFKGRLIAVLPEANTETRTLRVRIELANPNGRLRPGMFAQVRLESGDQTPHLYVASESVIRTGTRTVVVVAGAQGRFVPTQVQTGGDVDGKTIILRGLTEGQKVVASGQFLIDSEASLKGVLTRLGGSKPEGSPPLDNGSMRDRVPDRQPARGSAR
ncbi:MAG: efflux transporter periplasmic adaptor subunit [Gammaproteobacteria bacterium]|nr:efflux transporter periplasmic adaptor subunit [Gammaproteobacteria bacterium]